MDATSVISQYSLWKKEKKIKNEYYLNKIKNVTYASTCLHIRMRSKPYQVYTMDLLRRRMVMAFDCVFLKRKKVCCATFGVSVGEITRMCGFKNVDEAVIALRGKWTRGMGKRVRPKKYEWATFGWMKVWMGAASSSSSSSSSRGPEVKSFRDSFRNWTAPLWVSRGQWSTKWSVNLCC